jgi:two-component system phosphate regulon response regulator PhoB/two-component system alkaline phosphatase synthesis response regulator PhoP
MAENKKRILIVEDDPVLSSMYKTKFELDGFEVITVASGPAGLETAKKEKFDIIFLDVILPQIDGFTVLEEIKRNPETKDIPVVMLTNLGTQEDMEKGKRMGAIDYIVKASLTPSQVSDKIKEYLK